MPNAKVQYIGTGSGAEFDELFASSHFVRTIRSLKNWFRNCRVALHLLCYSGTLCLPRGPKSGHHEAHSARS